MEFFPVNPSIGYTSLNPFKHFSHLKDSFTSVEDISIPEQNSTKQQPELAQADEKDSDILKGSKLLEELRIIEEEHRKSQIIESSTVVLAEEKADKPNDAPNNKEEEAAYPNETINTETALSTEKAGEAERSPPEGMFTRISNFRQGDGLIFLHFSLARRKLHR